MSHSLSAAALLLCAAMSFAGRPACASGAGVDSAVLLHTFDQTGYNPLSGPVLGPSGHLFGTVPNGGTAGCFAGLGCGAVYEVAPGVRGASPQYRTIYLFTGGADGSSPTAKPTVTRSGVVYGYSAGNFPGSVFELTPPAAPGQPWVFDTIYDFANGGGNVSSGGAPLLFQKNALYGLAGADSNSLFRLSPPVAGQGAWTETTLYRFPAGQTALSLVSDGALGFFAIMSPSRVFQGGSVVRLNPPEYSKGKWTETTIATFGSKQNFDTPNGLIAAADGNLYLVFGRGVYQLVPPQPGGAAWSVSKIATPAAGGYGPSAIEIGWQGSLIVTIYGDQDLFGGVVFQLTPPGVGGGGWTTTLLTNFNTNSFPSSNPIDAVGGPGNVVYGAVNNTYDNGAVFGLYPPN